MTPSNGSSGRSAFFKVFVFLVAYLVVAGWGLSLVRGLNWLGWITLPGLMTAAFLLRKWSQGNLRAEVLEPLIYWPFLLVSLLSLIAAFLYPPTMLDSLTYRLPRILIWLQDGYVHHFQSAEDRLNYMPQVWGLATIPLIKIGSERLIWFWSFISWVTLYLLAYEWALEKTNDPKRSRLFAFVGSASTFSVLQAGSAATDLFASIFALLALYFVQSFERRRSWWDISWAALSLGLAAGSKPHFTVLGLPFVIWFCLSRAQPWKAFRWAWSPILLALWLVCSPAPGFFLNYRTYGSLGGPGQDHSMTGDGPGWNFLAGSTMIVWQSIQPPINPLAPVYNSRLEKMVRDSGFLKRVPRFQLTNIPVAMVDKAALGMVTSIAFVLGIVLAFRRDFQVVRSWKGLAAMAGLIGIMLALSRFVSSGSGRAFCGFLYFCLPLAIAGWALMRPRTVRIIFWLTLLSSLCALILNPSRRLWPAETVHNAFAASPKFRKVADLMQPYVMIPERAKTGAEVMQAIPDWEKEVVVLIAPDRPIWPLLNASSVDRHFSFLPRHATPSDLENRGANYVVVGGPLEEVYGEICDYLEKSGQYEVVFSQNYTSKLARGPEEWKLYRKRTSSAAAQSAQ